MGQASGVVPDIEIVDVLQDCFAVRRRSFDRLQSILETKREKERENDQRDSSEMWHVFSQCVR